MFDLRINRPQGLWEAVEEVDERVVLDGCPESRLRGLRVAWPEVGEEGVRGTGSGEVVRVERGIGE